MLRLISDNKHEMFIYNSYILTSIGGFMANIYNKLKNGVITTLGVGLVASSLLYGASDVSAKEIEERMISQATQNSTIQTSFEYGNSQMGNSEKEDLQVGLKAIPLKIYKTKDDGKTVYFDFGTGGKYTYNNDSGVFTFGLPYDKSNKDLKIIFDSNFLVSNAQGNGFKFNVNTGIIASGSLEDSLSTQGAEKTGFDLGVSAEFLKTLYHKGNFTTFSLGLGYDHSRETFSKDPDGRDQAIDTRYNTLNIPLKMMHYNAGTNSISTIDTFLNIDLNTGEIGGGAGLETMFKNFGVRFGVEKSSKGVGIDLGAKAVIGDFELSGGLKTIQEQANPNTWNSDFKTYVGLGYNFKPKDKNRELMVEGQFEEIEENNDKPLVDSSKDSLEDIIVKEQ
ncbi:MAG: hypothetical protein PHT94_01635 [Candidatus Nanoarchaeia archaeon]|nr:hypothetical protein [Candidatus Nanoarchaeia archaeon]